MSWAPIAHFPEGAVIVVRQLEGRCASRLVGVRVDPVQRDAPGWVVQRGRAVLHGEANIAVGDVATSDIIPILVEERLAIR